MFLTEIEDSDCIKKRKNVCSLLSILITQTLALSVQEESLSTATDTMEPFNTLTTDVIIDIVSLWPHVIS